MSMFELYDNFKNNIWIHWGILSEEVKTEICKQQLILREGNKYYMFGKEILGIKR
jgi:hypothetical protein